MFFYVNKSIYPFKKYIFFDITYISKKTRFDRTEEVKAYLGVDVCVHVCRNVKSNFTACRYITLKLHCMLQL